MKLSDFLASKGTTVNDVIVMGTTNAPGPVSTLGVELGGTAAQVTGPTFYAVLLDIGEQDADIPL